MQYGIARLEKTAIERSGEQLTCYPSYNVLQMERLTVWAGRPVSLTKPYRTLCRVLQVPGNAINQVCI